MLHKETVESGTLELIQMLQKEPVLKDFILVGGTALALQTGHRTSVDIDLFTTEDFDVDKVIAALTGYDLHINYRDKNTINATIAGIKVDILAHKYPLIGSIIREEGVHMASLEDISAMKVNAIAGNGTRVKDFIDIYYLLDIFSFKQTVSFFTKKYKQESDFHAIKSLCYFDDVDLSDWPIMLKDEKLTWKQVKDKIIKASTL